MKVVLSRKGFDSECGGYPSLILPNKEMIMLPIPQNRERYKYSDLSTNNGENLCDIMKSLKKEIISSNGEKKILTKSTQCHLDPDICDQAIKRKKDWRGALGQADAAYKVLEHAGVKEGDLFIFFGWYNDVLIENNEYKFAKGNGRHTMFGYLQIDKIIQPRYDKIPKEIKSHPHAVPKSISSETNTIYVAKDVCTFDKNIKGWGMFEYDEELDLTKKGMSRTCWKLPAFFKGLSITYHNKNSFKKGYFKSACRGQEFVIEENKDVEKWAINLIKKYSTNRIK